MWLQEWYKNQCNGDWEHNYGITIKTIDNPGWHITIDLAGTNLETLHVGYKLIENNEDDWYGYSIINSQFQGSGDPSKLIVIINKFKDIVEGKV